MKTQLFLLYLSYLFLNLQGFGDSSCLHGQEGPLGQVPSEVGERVEVRGEGRDGLPCVLRGHTDPEMVRQQRGHCGVKPLQCQPSQSGKICFILSTVTYLYSGGGTAAYFYFYWYQYSIYKKNRFLRWYNRIMYIRYLYSGGGGGGSRQK